MSAAVATRKIFDGYEGKAYTAPVLVSGDIIKPTMWREIFTTPASLGTYSVMNLAKGNQFILDCQGLTILTNAAGSNIGTFPSGILVEITAITDSGGFVARPLTGTMPNVKFSTSSAASGVVPTGAAWSGARVVIWENTTDGAMAVTTPSAAAILAALIAAGYSSDNAYILRITNRGDNTVTLTGGDSVTITGEATIATLATRDYVVTMNILLGTVTLRSTNKGTIET